MKLLVFGGAFDPPHAGHRELLKVAAEKTEADEILVIPTALPPHKKEKTPFSYRFEMAELAFGDMARVSDMEKHIIPSYSFVTLEKLWEEYGCKPYFAIGGDSVKAFRTWREPGKIAASCVIVAVRRGGEDLESRLRYLEREFNAEILRTDKEITDISSCELRVLLEFENALGEVREYTDKRAGDYILPSVLSYIGKQKLYSVHTDSIRRIAQALKPARLRHTYFVTLTGSEIAHSEGLDADEVFQACLLHDCAKYMLPLSREYGIDPDAYPEPVLHAFLGAKVAEREYDVSDADILNAVKFHTTGRLGMSKLEKTVYTADYAAEGRGDFALPVRRALKLFGLETGFKTALLSCYSYLLKEKGKDMFHLTADCFEYYASRDPDMFKALSEGSKGAAEAYLDFKTAKECIKNGENCNDCI